MENFLGHTPRVFKKILYVSIAAHIIVIAVLGIYLGGKKKVFFSPVYTVSLVEHARRPARKRTRKVHIRAARKKKAVKKHVIKKKAAKKAVVVKKKKASVKAKKPARALEKDLSDAISTIRKRVRAKEEQKLIASKIEAIKKRQEAEELARRLEKIRGSIKEAPAGAATGKSTPLRAAASSGLSKESLQIKHKAYFSLIRDRVQENWIYPETLDNEKISVIVSIRIGRDGELIKSWVEKGSGNRQFDDSLLKAVKKASPFPPLPEDFQEDILETGLRFCPGCE